MQNKSIIISLITFLALSFGFLAYTETDQQSSSSQNWWVVCFENPKDESLNFIIENKSANDGFHWEILSEENIIENGSANVREGEAKKIEISNPEIEIQGDEKLTVRVQAGNETKEIYKIFEK